MKANRIKEIEGMLAAAKAYGMDLGYAEELLVAARTLRRIQDMECRDCGCPRCGALDEEKAQVCASQRH